VHRITKIGALAAIGAVGVIATATAASASVTVNQTPSGLTGFIGKGDVQTALGGLNNAKIQALVDANGVKFTSTQAGSQALTSSATQFGTQAGVQSGQQSGTQVGTQTTAQEVTETTVCTKKNGQQDQRSRHGDRSVTRTAIRTASRDAARDASRSASREGSRTGSRTGTLSGVVNADIDVKARKTGQWTGWNVLGFLGQPSFAPTVGSENFGEPSFPNSWVFSDADWQGIGAWSPVGDGTWTFTSDFDFGAPVVFSEDPASLSGVTWSAWDTDNDPNADPDTCFQNSNNLVPGSFHDTFAFGTPSVKVDDSGSVTEGGVVDGGFVADGDPVPTRTEFGPTKYGDVSATGPLALFVTGTGYGTKPLPISAV
jgi:hypothetical protein